MDDQLILKILSSIPADQQVDEEKLLGAGVTAEQLKELKLSQLVRAEQTFVDTGHLSSRSCWFYHRTIAGSDWIRDYHRRLQEDKHRIREDVYNRKMSKMTCAVLVVSVLGVCVGIVAAFPNFREIVLWLLRG